MLLLALALAQAPEKLDLSAEKADLRVLTDGAHHYVVYNPNKGYSSDFFYGDGKTLAKLRVKGGGQEGDRRFDVTLWDPRVIPTSGASAGISMRDSGKAYEIQCGKRMTKLEVVGADDASKLLGGATFLSMMWTRLPERLLRDERGSYYFVDRFRADDPLDRRDFRLFIGMKGKMQLQSLKDVVDDSQGMIFSTRNGDLRLVANRAERGSAEAEKTVRMKWVAGRTELPLIEVTLDDYRNSRMVYTELGPYDGQRLGTPCDDLM